jgi:hypothetical protein
MLEVLKTDGKLASNEIRDRGYINVFVGLVPVYALDKAYLARKFTLESFAAPLTRFWR